MRMVMNLPARVRRAGIGPLLQVGLAVLCVLLLLQARAAAQFAPLSYEGVAIYAADCRDSSRLVVAGGRGMLAVSRDGGLSWQLSTPLPEAVLTDVQYLDDLHILAVGTIVAARGHPLGVAVRSSDGGTTWTAQTLPAGLLRIAFAASGAGYALSVDGSVLRSQDGGWSWEATAPLAGVFNPRSSALYVADPSTVLAGTLSGAGRSENAGASWQALSPPRLGAWIAAWASGRNHLWFAGEYGMAHSDDAGMTWHVDRPWPGMRLIAMRQSDGGEWYAIVTPIPASGVSQPLSLFFSPALLRSTDGGRSWHRVGGLVPLATGAARAQQITALCTAAPDTLYLIGEQGAIFKSLDGGASWTALGTQVQALSQREPVSALSWGCALPAEESCAERSIGTGAFAPRSRVAMREPVRASG
jgi:photosystem II stability/assembly factor-like uncharacterized protein